MSSTLGSIVEVIVGAALEFTPLAPFGTALIIAGVSSEAARLLAPGAPAPAPIEGTALQTDAYANLVYGTRRVGGVLNYRNTSGTNNETLDIVIWHAITDRTYGIDGFGSFYLNEQELRVRPAGNWSAGATVALGDAVMDANGNAQECVTAGTTGATTPSWKTVRGDVTDDNTVQWRLVGTQPSDFTWDGTVCAVDSDGYVRPNSGKCYVHGHVTDGDFSGMVELWAYVGRQAAFVDIDPTLNTTYGIDPRLPWKDTAVGAGCVWTHWRFTPGNDANAFQKAFGGSLPHSLEAVVRGETSILDPRTGTRGYNEAPALIARDFLTGSEDDGKCKVDGGWIDDTNTTNPSANVCDQTVTMADGTQQPRFRASGVMSCGRPRIEELRRVLAAMSGALVNRSTSVNNLAPICIFSGSYSSPVGTIDETFLRGGLSLDDPDYGQRYNCVRATYADRYNGWQSMPAPAYPAIGSATLAAWMSDDAGRELDQPLQLDFVVDADRAQLNAAILANKSRFPETLTLECNAKPILFNTYDRVWLNIAELGISGDVYQITRMTRHEDWTWDLELERDDSSIWGSVTTADGLIVGENYSVTTMPPQPSGFAMSGYSGGVALTWTPPDPHRVQYAEIWTSSDGTTYALLDRVGAAAGQYLWPLANGLTRYGKVRFSNGKAAGAFTAPDSATSGLAQAGADKTPLDALSVDVPLYDPDFELGEGWSGSGTLKTSDPLGAYSGVNYLEFDGASQTENNAKEYSIGPGQVLEIDGWVDKTALTAGNVSVSVEILDASGNVIDTLSENV